MHELVVEQSKPSDTVKDIVQQFRLSVCYAFLIDNIKFSTLGHTYGIHSLRNLLEYQKL